MIEKMYLSQLEKQYKAHLRNVIDDCTFEPIVLRGGKTKPKNAVELHKLIAAFKAKEKSTSQPGWQIEWENWFSKKLGHQIWPSSITVPSVTDFLFLIDKQHHCTLFKRRLDQLMRWNTGIRPFITERPQLVVELDNDWDSITTVIDYLLNNDVTGHYVRSIPVPVHTKFIQHHKNTILGILKLLKPDKFCADKMDFELALGLHKKPYLFSCRFLDLSLAAKYCSGLDIVGIATETLKGLDWEFRHVILVENETNLFLLPEIKNTIAICSSGKALHLLKESSFFNTVSLYYWGDLDEEGFKMLNDIKYYYPHTKSIFMDEATITYHKKEIASQPNTYKATMLNNLNNDEAAAFNMLAPNGRIEQEKLEQQFVINNLRHIIP